MIQKVFDFMSAAFPAVLYLGGLYIGKILLYGGYPIEFIIWVIIWGGCIHQNVKVSNQKKELNEVKRKLLVVEIAHHKTQKQIDIAKHMLSDEQKLELLVTSAKEHLDAYIQYEYFNPDSADGYFERKDYDFLK